MRMGVAERVGDMKEQTQFQPSLPHLDHRAIERADPEQWRIGMHLFKIAANRDQLEIATPSSSRRTGIR